MTVTILIVGPIPPPMGGIATYVEDMLKSDLNKEYNIFHLNTARSPEIKKSFAKNSILFCKNSLKLVCLLLSSKPKIVHIHTSSYMAFWEKSIFLIISKILSKKVILHIHGGGFKNFYLSKGIIVKYLIKFLLNLSDTIIVLSSAWKEFFIQVTESNKVAIIHNAVNTKFYEIGNIKTPINNGTFQILFAGYLSKDKGIYDILDSIPLVVKKHKDVKFVFAGAEDKSGELKIIKERIIKNDIGNYVSFIGVLSKREITSAYRNSDLFILPSYTEGMPLTVLEAMAAGLPVISTPVGSIPEVINERINGFLVMPGDCIGLANKILELIEDPKLRETMAQNNLEKIRTEYNWRITANNISILYNELLALE